MLHGHAACCRTVRRRVPSFSSWLRADLGTSSIHTRTSGLMVPCSRGDTAWEGIQANWGNSCWPAQEVSI